MKLYLLNMETVSCPRSDCFEVFPLACCLPLPFSRQRVSLGPRRGSCKFPEPFTIIHGLTPSRRNLNPQRLDLSDAQRVGATRAPPVSLNFKPGHCRLRPDAPDLWNNSEKNPPKFHLRTVVAFKSQGRSPDLGSLWTKFPSWFRTWLSVHFRVSEWPSANKRMQLLPW